MKFILIGGFLFLTLIHAEENVEVINVLEYDKVEQDFPKKDIEKKITLPKRVIDTETSIPTYNNSNNYKTDVERHQMILRAKYLEKKYNNALMKLENWESKKELLKIEFREKYRKEETSFGTNDSFGKRRADKRRREFYNSLKKEEEHIQKLVDDANLELTKIKEKFLFKYAVPLTREVMAGQVLPSVADKEKKIEMLHEYINENAKWKKCLEKVRDYDNISSVVGSIEKLFADLNLTETEIAKRMEKNRAELEAHRARYNEIEREFQSKFGLAILNKDRASRILENIKKN